MKQSIEYSTSLDRAVLEYASRMRENLLFNIYKMGKSSIERGSKDTWTANPRRDAEMRDRSPSADDSVKWAAMKSRSIARSARVHHSLEPAGLSDRDEVRQRAARDGHRGRASDARIRRRWKKYPAGSYVVKTAQAFRPHIMDMFEPQVHPDVIPYPGANPTPPYDNAGWTLAFQMGIQFDRILDGFTGPFEKIGPWQVAPPVGNVSGGAASGYTTTGGRTMP